MRRMLSVLTVVTALTPLRLHAQSGACDPSGFRAFHSRYDELQRIAELTDTTGGEYPLFRRNGARLTCDSTAHRTQEIRMVPAAVLLAERTGYAGGVNDGALWQGKGLSTIVSAGVFARWHFLSVAVAPEFTFAQNESFDFRASGARKRSTFVDPFHSSGLDKPVRMGDAAFSKLYLGQSFLRAEVAGFEAVVSTQNLRIGPGVRNTLLMTDNAAGFGHLSIGTARPHSVGIGDLSVQLLGGQLHESRFYDSVPTNDRDDISLLHVGFSPRGLPTLTVGASRVFVLNPARQQVSLSSLFRPLLQTVFKNALATPTNPTGDNPDNQLISLDARWVFPDIGFEAYGQWGREDHSATLDDFLQEPEHSQAYVLGLQKAFRAFNRQASFGTEVTNLQHYTAPRVERPLPTWYTHAIHGYTNQGQLLGAGIGPGGRETFVYGRLAGSASLLTIHYRSTFYEDKERFSGANTGKPDKESGPGAEFLFRRAGFEVTTGAEFVTRPNRQFRFDGGNISIQLGVRYGI